MNRQQLDAKMNEYGQRLVNLIKEAAADGVTLKIGKGYVWPEEGAAHSSIGLDRLSQVHMVPDVKPNAYHDVSTNALVQATIIHTGDAINMYINADVPMVPLDPVKAL